MASYLNSIRQGNCREVIVDSFWQRMTQIYFPLEGNYLHEREEYASPNSRSRANVTLAVLHNDQRKKGLVIECKKPPGNRSGFPPPNSWLYTRKQLERFLVNNRVTETSLVSGTFGIVGIGMYVRFFTFPNDSVEMMDFQGDPNIYHIQRQGPQIEQKIRAMKTAIDFALANNN